MVASSINDSHLLRIGKEIASEVCSGLVEAGKTRSLGDICEAEKSASGDQPKYGDIVADSEVKKLLPRYRNGNIEGIVLISEESGIHVFPENSQPNDNYVFIILDPVDGSNNLRKHSTPSPGVGMSIAMGLVSEVRREYEDDFGLIRVIVIRDIFNRRSCWAVRGQKAWSENFGSPIRVANTSKLSEAIIGIDLDRSKVESYSKQQILRSVQFILQECACQRRIGSSALDFCKVASGEYDAFLSPGKRMGFYDIAGVKLLIESAGGIIQVDWATPPEKNILYRLIFKKEKSLLKKMRFNVRAACSSELLHEINQSFR